MACIWLTSVQMAVVQDYSNVDVSAAGTIVAGGKLGMACGDAGGTIRMFAYAQAHPHMWRGKRLLPLCALPALTGRSCCIAESIAASEHDLLKLTCNHDACLIGLAGEVSCFHSNG